MAKGGNEINYDIDVAPPSSVANDDTFSQIGIYLSLIHI